MKTQYATMVGNICLDKSLPNEETGKGTPITFEIWKVYNGSFFPGHNPKDCRLASRLDNLDMAVWKLQSKWEKHLGDVGIDPNQYDEELDYKFWLEDQRYSFSHDNYQICITTSNRDLL